MKVIVTGASGMVGEGVMMVCLENPDITEVLVVGRRSCGHVHPKLRELIHRDFFDLSSIENGLAGFDACFFCLGVSSVGLSAEDYRHMTYDLTLEMGRRLARLSPDMTFCYVTGANTDSTEKGSVRWARVKGETENELLRLFKNGYMFRPGGMIPMPGQKNLKPMYRVFVPLLPLFKLVFPKMVCTLKQVGQAMIACAKFRPAKHILEVHDIVEVAALR